jgi:UDPglucose 6-dehydrogenase
MNVDKISIIGLGKLGLPLLTTFAKNNQKVIGYDVDVQKINSLKNKEIPFYEPNLEEFFIKYYDNIEVGNDTENLVLNSNVAIILVNTPSDGNGEFSNDYVFKAIELVSKSLKNSKSSDFLFIISSTVMPGTHKKIIDLIELNSGRKINEGFGLLYIPDLVALGSVIYDFENPDLLILGESDKKYGDIGEIIYKKIIKNNAPIVRMSLIEGEISKVSLNAYITMKISFANFIGNVSEKFSCNPNNITKALGYDRRISPYYIKSGLSFGGTCFPRDTWAFIKMSEQLGLDAVHIKATQTINEQQNKYLFDKVSNFKDKKIGIFGLSFKPNTSVTTESAGDILYSKLKSENYEVYGCDKLVKTDFNYTNINDFIKKCDVLVLIHDDKEIISKNIENIKTKILINPWNIAI